MFNEYIPESNEVKLCTGGILPSESGLPESGPGVIVRDMRVRAHGSTHPGLVRSNNEDVFAVVQDKGLFVVADGMAGHRYGEIASAICVNTISRMFTSPGVDRLVESHYRYARAQRLIPRGLSLPAFKLRLAVEESNLAVFSTAQANRQYETMGTTVVAALQSGKNMVLAHVGDSRIYRLRRGHLTQMTYDHSLLNEYLRLGFIRKSEARQFPMKNVIVRAIGLADRVDVAVRVVSSLPGDRFLLCTDGLTDIVHAATISRVIRTSEGPQQAVDALIETALKAGGNDNVTALMVFVEGNDNE